MLSAMGSIAQVVSAIAVCAAVVFAVFQVREFRRQRRDMAGVELMRLMQSRELDADADHLMRAGRAMSAADVRAMGPEYAGAAYRLVALYETLGLLVSRGTVPLDLVRELVTGPLLEVWRACDAWVEDVRARYPDQRYGRWFQWLYQRLLESGAGAQQTPASIGDRRQGVGAQPRV